MGNIDWELLKTNLMDIIDTLKEDENLSISEMAIELLDGMGDLAQDQDKSSVRPLLKGMDWIKKWNAFKKTEAF